MKKKSPIAGFLCVVALFLMVARCPGQGTFLFWTFVPGEVNAQVLDADGNPLFGTGYMAQLYGGQTQDSLTPALIWSSSQTLPPTSITHVVLGQGGYIQEFTWARIQGVLESGLAWLQVRAWDARLGSTYEEVAGLGIGGYGESNLILSRAGDASIGLPPGRLVGLQSFSLLPVIPEPGGAALL